jgi:aspartokinase
MKPTIMKFGGTSVEGATAFKNVAGIVFDRRSLRPVVIVSAMAGFTDALLGSVQEALNAGSAGGTATLEKHFDRHLRVIDALLSEETPRMRELVNESRAEIAKRLNAAAAEVGHQRNRRKIF